jgi:hypothetical protein
VATTDVTGTVVKAVLGRVTVVVLAGAVIVVALEAPMHEQALEKRTAPEHGLA